jgi:hypothetical protein
MAKLTRYLQKIFANNSNEVGVFGTGVNKQTSKNVETLQSADYENGWSSAIITNKNYPIWQEMDGVQYGLSYQLKYLSQSGMPEWLSTETYYTNNYCRVGSNIYYSLQDDNTNHNPALNDGWWTPLLTSNRSIGEIVPSTIPLTEAGLHLLDGSLITNGMYADFITYMANLTATAPDCFCSEADWQAAVTLTGVCDKFVYDSVNNTVRLLKYGNQIITKTSAISTASTVPVKGNGMTLGFTDGNGHSYGLQASTLQQGNRIFSSSVFGSNAGSAVVDSGNPSAKTMGVTTVGDKSGLIADISSIKNYPLDCYYYIVIATSTKTSIQVDIDEIATDLNGKADVDLSNVPTSKGILTARYVNGTSWYRVYSDGWCMQGGLVEATNGQTGFTVSLLQNYVNTNYQVIVSAANSAYSTTGYGATNLTVSQFDIFNSQNTARQIFWLAMGYIN